MADETVTVPLSALTLEQKIDTLLRLALADANALAAENASLREALDAVTSAIRANTARLNEITAALVANDQEGTTA
jgi:hypothetical protein